MKNYIGIKWNMLSENEKTELLSNANAIDGTTGNNMRISGKCVIDLTGELSISGEIEITEDENIISIDGEAVIYSSSI